MYVCEKERDVYESECVVWGGEVFGRLYHHAPHASVCCFHGGGGTPAEMEPDAGSGFWFLLSPVVSSLTPYSPPIIFSSNSYLSTALHSNYRDSLGKDF